MYIKYYSDCILSQLLMLLRDNKVVSAAFDAGRSTEAWLSIRLRLPAALRGAPPR